MKIEYENLTQARPIQDKTEEPIKVVKEVIKHTKRQKTHLKRGRKRTQELSTQETQTKTHTFQENKKKLQYPNSKRKQRKQNIRRRKKHITIEKVYDKNVTETILYPEKGKHTLETGPKKYQHRRHKKRHTHFKKTKRN